MLKIKLLKPFVSALVTTIFLIISGSLEDNNPKLALGVVLFVIACVFPYVVLSVLV